MHRASVYKIANILILRNGGFWFVGRGRPQALCMRPPLLSRERGHIVGQDLLFICVVVFRLTYPP